MPINRIPHLFISLFYAFLLIASLSAAMLHSHSPPVLAQQEFAGGSGTAEDPYLVATAVQLDNIRNHLDAHFRQTADINVGVAPFNEGAG